MPKYRNILIAVECYQEFEEEVGIFIEEGGFQLIGTAILTKRKRSLYADLLTTFNLEEYFPTTKSLANNIDLIIFTKIRQSNINRIKDQLIIQNKNAGG